MANLVDELMKAVKPKKDKLNKTHAATVSHIDKDGTVWVYVAGSDRETPTASAASEVKKGDSVNVEWRNNKLYIAGNYSNPSAGVARVRNVENVSANNTKIIQAQEASIVNLQVSKADIGELTAAEARIGELEADHVSVDDLEASNARIQNLETDHVTVSDFQAEQAKITTLQSTALTADSAVITNLQTSKADVTDLNAATGRITNLETNALTAESAVITDLQADTAKIHNLTANQLSAATGYIGSLNSENITVNDLKAVKATVNDLDANYAQIDLANVNNAWIQNGVVKDASIADAKIIGMSANKLTAGTIDASNITVTNLNADNITAGSISVDGITIDVTNNEASIDGSYIEEGTITLNGLAQEVTDKIEGAIETWTGSTVPTLNNYPAVDWNTAQLRKNHVGDVYYVVNAGNQADGYCYRFANTGTTANPSYGWILIKDSDVTAALQRLIDAEGDIDDLQSFESTTSSWITETDEELSSIKTNHTSLVAVVDKTLVSTTQLWYTKANTTAPSKPTAHVTSTSTAGNAWRTVVPAYNSTYPNYFYCYEWEYADGTYGWSDVTRDIGMGETQSTARTASTNASTALTNAATAQSAAEGAQSTANTAVTNAATAQTTANTANTNAQAAQNTANANIKSTVQLWFTKANTTAPSKPTAHVTTNNASTANAWNIAVPTYNATYPNYFYCYEYQKGDNTYSWSDVVLDRATTENQANARSALSQVATKVETSVFNTVSQQVDTNTANITSLSNTVSTKADSSTVTTLSNTVNAVSQKADTNESNISNLTTRVSDAETTISNHTTSITQNTNAITLKANATDVYTKTQTDGLITTEVENRNSAITASADAINLEVSKKVGTSEVISKINQSPESITINVDRVNIEGATIFSSGRLSTTSLNNAYDAKGAADAAVANLEIGGRNLLLGTGGSDYTKVRTADMTNSILSNLAISMSNGEITMKPGTATTDEKYFRFLSSTQGNMHGLIPGETYTLSCYVKGSLGSGAYVLARSQWCTTGGWEGGSQPRMSISSEYVFFTKTETIPSDATAYYTSFQIYDTTTDTTVYIKNLKLEKGNKATDWSPAPEDLNVQEQRIYYKTSATTAPAAPTSWVTSTATAALTWTTKRMPYDQTNKYLYTCTQRQAVGGGITNSTVLLDDTTTVIDGGNIITGTVTANKLDADNINASGTLTVGALSSAAQSQVLNSEIEIGGRNLLSDTKAFGTIDTTGWPLVNNGLTLTAETYKDLTVKEYPSTTLSSGTKTLVQYILSANKATEVIQLGATYVCSFYAKGTGSFRTYFYANDPTVATWTASDGTSGTAPDGAKIWTLTSEWERYWIAYTLSSTGTPGTKRLLFRHDYNASTTLSAKLCGLKLELGNVATDWSPAPEDVDAAVSDAAKTATNYLTTITGTSGISVHDAGDENNFVNINSSGMNVYQGGKTDAYKIASFGASRAQIGKDSKSRAIMDNHSFQMYYGTETNSYVHFSDFRDDNGYATLTDTFVGDGRTSGYTVSHNVYSVSSVEIEGTTAAYSVSGNTITLTSGNLSNGNILTITYVTTDEVKAFTFGDRIGSGNELGNRSMTVGVANGASGENAFAHGIDCHASGNNSFASGYLCVAKGNYSHAEGYYTVVNGDISHAEGYNTTASGAGSHAEGHSTTASGPISHAEGYETIAQGPYSHAQGVYNIANSNHAFIIGNGTSDAARSNALTVAWDGNIEMALDTSNTQTASVDYALNAAITALGWGSDVVD